MSPLDSLEESIYFNKLLYVMLQNPSGSKLASTGTKRGTDTFIAVYLLISPVVGFFCVHKSHIKRFYLVIKG